MEGKKEKSFEKREMLVKAALIEFGDKGYENASLNNILKEADISKGTFYYHFKNKEGLYVYLYDILAQEKLKFLKERINPEDFNKDIFTVLMVMSKAGVDFASCKPEIDRFSSSFLKDLNNPILDNIKEKYNLHNNDFLNSIVDRAYERGEIREDMPREFAKNIIPYLLVNLQDITKSIDINQYEKEYNYLIDFLKNGLGKRD